MQDTRQIIDHRVREWGVSLASLSKDLGRNAGWLQQYLRCGTPRVLPDRERRMLAERLDLEETLLATHEAWSLACAAKI